MRGRQVFHMMFASACLLWWTVGCHAEAAGNIVDYQMVNLAACKKPQIGPPVLAAESHGKYNAQRRFLNLDGSGTCVVMDFWVERLGDSDSPGMRTLQHRFLRFESGKWKPFQTRLMFYPYAIEERSSRQEVFIVAPNEWDIGDDMALAMDGPSLFTPTGWVRKKGKVDRFGVAPVDANRGEILQALAAMLSARLQSDAELSAKPASAKPASAKVEAERARIKSLLDEAKKDAGIGVSR